MNEFTYSVLVVGVVCAFTEALIPKEHKEIKTFTGLFAVIGIVAAFGLFHGFPPFEPVAVEYEDRTYYALEKAYEKQLNALAEKHGLSVEGLELKDGSLTRIYVKGKRSEAFEKEFIGLFNGEISYE